MNMYEIMKKKENKLELTTEELIESFAKKTKITLPRIAKKSLIIGVACLLLFSVILIHKFKTTDFGGDISFDLVTTPVAAMSSKRDVINIPSGIVKANPFLPYRKLGNEIKEETLINDVPKFDLVEPPDFVDTAKDNAKIMETVVSGILFDKYSPSAILKIEGNDYLVKKGDVVHGYKIISIAQNSVTVQQGKNTYKAGIGELLTDGSVNYNDVSNLNKKFGGLQKWGIII